MSPFSSLAADNKCHSSLTPWHLITCVEAGLETRKTTSRGAWPSPPATSRSQTLLELFLLHNSFYWFLRCRNHSLYSYRSALQNRHAAEERVRVQGALWSSTGKQCMQVEPGPGTHSLDLLVRVKWGFCLWFTPFLTALLYINSKFGPQIYLSAPWGFTSLFTQSRGTGQPLW